jgi:hypothetical protein
MIKKARQDHHLTQEQLAYPVLNVETRVTLAGCVIKKNYSRVPGSNYDSIFQISAYM